MSADDYVGRPNYVQPLPGAKCSIIVIIELQYYQQILKELVE